MKYLLYIITIIILAGTNAGLFAYFKISGVVPNLLLILVTIMSLENQNEDYYFIALLGGLFLDFYSGLFPGSFAFAFLALGFFIRLCAGYVLVREKDWKSLIAILAAAILFTDAFIRIYGAAALKLHWYGQTPGFAGFWPKAAIQWGYSLLLLYPMLQLYRLLRYTTEDLLAKQKKNN